MSNKEYQKMWKLKNKDKVKEYNKKWYLKNKDKVKEYQKIWRLKNQIRHLNDKEMN